MIKETWKCAKAMQSSNKRWLLTGIVQILHHIYNLFVEQYLQPYLITHIP